MIIELPDGRELEAPDGLKPDQIKNIVQKHAGPKMVASHAAVPAGAPADKPGIVESAIRGGVQGATMGWGDEAASAIDAALPSFLRNSTSEAAVGNGQTFGDRRQNALTYYRNRNAAAEKANPGTYLATQVAGAVAPALAGGAPLTGGKALLAASGQGALQGAGYSDATSARGLASDTALGAGLGLAGYGVGQGLGAAASRVRGAAARRLGAATAKAEQQAATEVAEDVASKAGQLGAETQKASRQIENLLRLEQAKALTPAQAAELASLRSSGAVKAVEQSVAQGTLGALPAQAETVATKRAALDAAQQAAPQVTAARTAQLLKPSVKEDTKTFLKAYAEPALWALGGQQAGEALGFEPGQQGALAAAAGIIGGRTRAGKALYNRATRPGNQVALSGAQARLAALVDAMRRPAVSGVPASVTAAFLNGENP